MMIALIETCSVEKVVINKDCVRWNTECYCIQYCSNKNTHVDKYYYRSIDSLAFLVADLKNNLEYYASHIKTHKNNCKNKAIQAGPRFKNRTVI